ncbi:FtsX-like permease family protein [Brachybacterium sp. DNPG3]
MSRRPRTVVRLTPLRRHLAAVLTIALSCAFVAVMVLAGSLVQTSIRSQTASAFTGADAVVTTELSDDDWAATTPLPAPEVEGADAVWPLLQTYLEASSASDSTYLSASLLPKGAEGTDIVEGALPAADDEVLLDETAADLLGVGVGGTVSLQSMDYDEATGTYAMVDMTVSGIAAAEPGSFFGATPRLIIAQDHAAALLGPTAGTITTTWFVSMPEGTDIDAVVAAGAADGLEIISAEQAIEDATADYLRGFGALGAILAVFVVIALFTSAVVIANTFAVTLAQRTRSLALLRTLGATRRQVRGVVLRESLAVGLVGAAAGAVAGHLLVQLALLAASGLGWIDGLALVPVTVLSVLLPLIAGLLITLLASLAPMRAATRVAPLQALRPAVAAQRRGPGVRGILALVAVVLGTAAMVGGAVATTNGNTGLGVLAALAGGVLSFCGILLSLVVATRPLSALVGKALATVGGLPARVASANVARNPRRSAATIAALLIGTTLMTMMAVGASSAEATLTSELDSRRPIDMVVVADAMPADAAARVAAVDGMDTAVTAERGDIEVGAEEPMTLYATTPESIREVSHRPGLADLMVDGTVLLGQERAERFGVTDGQVLSVQGADGVAHELRVQVDANLQMSLVTEATLDQLVGDAATPVVMADFADPGTPERGDVNVFDLGDAVGQVVVGDGFEGAAYDVGGAERESYSQVLNVLLGITVGLLAVAVIVALVGVANTLALGVVERTGENALLRALGTTRRQMRAMLGWEGILLAIVGAVLGIVLGTVYGTLGIIALLGGPFPVTISLPWSQLALVLVLAVLAGAVASILPGRAAARTAPAEALAEAA